MEITSPLYYSFLFEKKGALIFGQLMTFASVMVVILTPILMRSTKSQSELMSLSISGLLFIVGYFLVFITTSIPVHFAAWALFSAAEVLLITKEGVYIANHSSSNHRGRIQGVLLTFCNIGLMLSFLGMGYFIEGYGFGSAWLLM